ARMKGAEPLLDKRRRTVQQPDARHREFQRVGGNLAEYRLEPLPDRGRSHRNLDHPIRADRNARAFAGAGRAALHIAAEPQPVIAALDELALHVLLAPPVELLQTEIEQFLVSSTVAVGFRTRVDMTHGWHLEWH